MKMNGNFTQENGNEEKWKCEIDNENPHSKHDGKFFFLVYDFDFSV